MQTGHYVLFSPIGMTDPISDCRDGSMLHIARRYRPKRVYLYLSKETAAFDKRDDRYRKALKLLDPAIEVIKFSNPELENVHLFDEFYDDFERKIREIKEENPGASVLLNVSSGTPAMKSALHTIAAMADGADCIPIQVSTPRRAHNERREDVKEYDIELQWACNDDNDADKYADRCAGSRHHNLLLKIKKEIMRNHVDAYDYHAALALAEASKGVDDRAKAYLRAACARVQLDARGVDGQLARACADDGAYAAFVPVREGNLRGMAEYLLWLGVKLKRGDFCDFIRGVSPLFLDLLEVAADKCSVNGVRIEMSTFCPSGRKRILSRRRLENSDAGRGILEILDPLFNCYHDSNLSSAHLAPIVARLSSSEKVSICVKRLREAEEVCRNRAAHEIVSVTEEWIKSECGMSPQEILAGLETLAEFSGITRSRISCSYEKMNGFIKNSLA